MPLDPTPGAPLRPATDPAVLDGHGRPAGVGLDAAGLSGALESPLARATRGLGQVLEHGLGEETLEHMKEAVEVAEHGTAPQRDGHPRDGGG